VIQADRQPGLEVLDGLARAVQGLHLGAFDVHLDEVHA
jgi:hypothetical protein